MLHRHPNHQRSIRRAALRDRSLLEKVKRICRPYVSDPYAQRYRFWLHYAQEHRAAS